MADHFAVKGGAFHTAFVGIWCLGIMTAIVGLLVALVVIRKERVAPAGKEAPLRSR